MTCRLCQSEQCTVFARLDRKYFRCPECDLVFVHERDLPSEEDERREYLLHDNQAEDIHYRRFLRQLSDPLAEMLDRARNPTALDFGCGPVPVLAMLLQESGIACETFDPIFARDESVFSRRYHAIACSEVIEHFHQPRHAFDALAGLLLPGGVLGIMTLLRTEGSDFENWHYRRDITHTALYSRRTFEWLASHYGWSVEMVSSRVAFFRTLPSASIP